jgi:serine/threonine-protein kinase
MGAEDDLLFELAGRVSDGTPVDWESERGRASSKGVRRQVGHLRLVDDVARFHRGIDTGADLSAMPTLDVTSERSEDARKTSPPRASMTWGHLEIREKIGEGGFGEVYRAWDRNLHREVALKLLKAEISAEDARTKTMLNEGRMLARVRHPNVITVYGAEIHDGRVGLWMELVRGRSLSRLMGEQGRSGAREATLIGIELCRALAAVHGAGLVHRDIKATNAMRDADGRFLLMDFGAGQELDAGGEGETDSISGTPLYLAPEVLLRKPATQRSDIYGMGVLLYHMVTGSFPVVGKTLRELENEHRSRRIRLLRDQRSDLPESFVKVVERALAWEPGERFATPGEMEQALTLSLGIETAAASGTRAGSQPGSRARRAGLLLAGVVGAAILGMGLWLVATREEPQLQSSGTAGRPSSSAYTVQASLYRQHDGKLERLDSGDELQVGDELLFEMTMSRDLYVYIFNEDAQGNAFALFPLPGFDLQNPLPAGRTHALPGRRNGASVRWQVNSAGGREHFIVLAGPKPLSDFDAEMSRLELPSMDRLAVAVPPALRERLRGIGGLVEAEDAAPDSGRLFEMARRLSGQAETVEGVWLREIQLLNPGE